ncbi:1e410e67-742a-4748-b352-facc0f03dd00 [Thermothielavioides terrestris]|uniref:1e410e67-742a-4748-b352-facc0f03dd00 n=1 Tax=Thermothielavioides terrestris TaxID=2587410 RepID=A0A3S4B7H0_9PEZI|nr:1e410e67-742a-4748-b352-facc0f03dd00 [Thermothielavioides terrestris]
MSKGDSKRI